MDEGFLIVGLGNPGERYRDTRHNIGFMCVQSLASRHGIQGRGETRMKAIVGRGRIAGKNVTIAQPLTYMNLSGEAVQAITSYYKIPLEHTLVVLDDAALPFGRIRFRPEGSAGSHNGLKSIIAHLNSQAFPRLRVGIGEPEGRQEMRDFVLARFTPEEQAGLPCLVATCADAMEHWLTCGIESAMNRYNGKNILPPDPPQNDMGVTVEQ